MPGSGYSVGHNLSMFLASFCVMNPSASKRRFPRFRRQFTLRTLFLLVGGVAAGLGAWHIWTDPYRREREAITAIEELGGLCIAEKAEGWITYVDRDAKNIVYVDTWHAESADDVLLHLARLPRLRTVRVRRSFDSRILATMMSRDRLTQLNLDGTNITDSDMANVGELVSLSVLNVSRTKITDLGTAYLSGLSDLLVFEAADTRIGDDGLAVIARCPSLDSLDVSRTLVTDEGLRHLAACRYLSRVTLNGTRITDAAVVWLSNCGGLIDLSIRDTTLSLSAVQKLRATLPQCRIDWTE